MSDDAKREGLSDERCDDIALDARERVRGMAAWGMHLDRALIRAGYALAAPVSAQTPAGERERFERWAAALDEPRYENGDYKNDHVQTQWEAWQAALFAGDRS